jgi:membrane metallo-endopeptidase-like protein 1
MTITELQEKYPYLNWLNYLNSLMPAETKFTTDDIIINGVPTFFEKLGQLLTNTPKNVIQNYLMWRFAFGSVPLLGQSFRDRQQEYIRIITGSEKENPRALTCTDIVLSFFPHALGSLYVRKHFDEAAKQNVMVMVDNLKVAFKEILDEIDWMDATTKDAAHKKVDAMKSEMAYADELRDDTKITEYYSDFDAEIDVANYYDTILKLRANAIDFGNDLHKPVDKDDWTTFIPPAIVNAYYNPYENTIEFPAAFLQGAFYNFDRPHYMNYGAVGFVIGHEV